MKRDLGTYHVRVEFTDGTGFYLRWDTNGRWIPPHVWRGGCSSLDAKWSPPVWETEEDLAGTVLFQFLENNYSCDCNLMLFLARAEGIEDPDTVCGETLEFKTIHLVRPDGTSFQIHPREVTH
jgi:hypothetical protein